MGTTGRELLIKDTWPQESGWNTRRSRTGTNKRIFSINPDPGWNVFGMYLKYLYWQEQAGTGNSEDFTNSQCSGNLGFISPG